MCGLLFYYAADRLEKLVPTVRWTVGGWVGPQPNINFCEAKMQTSLVTRSARKGKRSIGEEFLRSKNANEPRKLVPTVRWL